MTAAEPAAATTLPVAGHRAVIAALRAEARGRWWIVLVAAALLTVGAVSGLVAPWALGRIVDHAGAPGAARTVWQMGGAMLVAAVLGALAVAAGQILISRTLERILAALRERMLRAALSLPRSRVESAGTADVIARAGDDVSEVAGALPEVVPVLGYPLFTVLATAVGVAVLDWRFVIALAVVVPIHIWTVRWYLRTAPQIYLAERAAMATRAQGLLSALRGLDTVHAFGLQRAHLAKITAASWQVVRLSLRSRVVVNRFFGRLNLAEFLGTTSLLALGFLLVDSGLASLGTATAALLMFIRLFNPINELLLVVDDLQSAAASLSRIVGVVQAAADSPGPLRPVEPPPDLAAQDGAVRPLVELTGVCFEYLPGHPALRSIDLRLWPGERIAVVGSSGAGKSTLAALIAGVHEPTAGTRRLAPVVADSTVLLTQETYVFSGTLRDNLSLVAPAADDDELRRALSLAGADQLLQRLPDGLATVIGAGGYPLTAGEVQHLALARLALRDPELAVLDEPTAEAGSAGSDRLDRATVAATAGRAALVVAHRLDQAALADRVVVMVDGRIVETGTHQRLLADGRGYAELWRLFSAGRQPDPTDEAGRDDGAARLPARSDVPKGPVGAG